MIVRAALYQEIEIGKSFFYRKNIDDLSSAIPAIVVVGFVPLYVGPSQKDKEHTLCAVKLSSGEIILAKDTQLFARVG